MLQQKETKATKNLRSLRDLLFKQTTTPAWFRKVTNKIQEALVEVFPQLPPP